MEVAAEQHKSCVNRKYKWAWGHLNTSQDNKEEEFLRLPVV